MFVLPLKKPRSLRKRLARLVLVASAITVGLSGLTVLLTVPKAGAAITRENSATCQTAAAATSVSCTVTAPTNGNTLVAVIGTRGTTADRVSSISQTGATWTRAQQSTNANGVTLEVWYATNVSSAGTGVTINLAASLKAAAVVAEYSGINSASPVDVSATATGNSTTVSTGTTSTTSQADQVWIGGVAIINTDTFGTYSDSFSSVGDTVTTTGAAGTQVRAGMAERIVTATGTAGTSTTIGNARQFAGVVVTFNAAAGPTQVVFTTSARTVTAGVCSGAGNVITIQLQNASNTPTNPTGATVIRITSNSPSETIYSDSSCTTTLTNGDISFTTSENTKSFYIIDTRKSNPTWTLTAAKQSGPDTISSANQSITVNAGSVSRLVITLPGQSFTDGTGNSGSPTAQTAGGSFTITSISATDDYFNVNTGYTGARTLAYSGPSNSPAPSSTAPTYTTSVSFTSGQSTTTLTTTLYRAESTTITATESSQYGFASSSLTVNAGALFDYAVQATTPITAGVCSTASNTITANDQWDNQRSVDTSVVNMTTSGTGLTFYTTAACSVSTTQYTLSGGTVNFYYQTNRKQSGITITATKDADTPTGTSSGITVHPAAAATLLIRLPGQSFVDGTGITSTPNFSGLRTPNSTAGTAFSVDIKAVDAYNNLVDSGPSIYTGSKTISFNDSLAGNAPNAQAPSFPSSSVTFTNGEANGLSITYYNATSGRTVEADDTGTPVSGTASSTFSVLAANAANYGVSASSPQTAGANFNVTVTARDDWNNPLGNLYSPPSGSYVLTTASGNAPDGTTPSLGTLAQGDFTNGVATKTVTLYNAGTATVTASEPGPSTVTGTSGSIVVNPGSVSGHVDDSLVTGNATGTQGSPFTVTITLRDTWRNPVPGVLAGYITVSATGSPSITQPSVNTDSNGQTTATLTWAGTGTYTISVAIGTITLVQNDGVTADSDGFLDDTHEVTINAPGGGPSSGIRGGTRIQGGVRIQ
jgi:hypothetical protein